LFENGFARVRCPDCREEFLLAFSCKTRELCPSCAAELIKRIYEDDPLVCPSCGAEMNLIAFITEHEVVD
jgi:DNA-directed RNA polymerase subunit RPC12/RpoP